MLRQILEYTARSLGFDSMIMRFLTMTFTFFLLTACGQKGPLYLPDEGQETMDTTTEEDQHRREQDK
jgi:predicted small lipoprotein YifL